MISEDGAANPMKLKLTSDNSILVFAYKSSPSSNGGHYLQKIGADGSLQYPSFINIGFKLQCLVREPLPNPDEELPPPDTLCFISCSPNPFNPRVNIAFSIPSQGKTKLGVYDLRGRKIRVLVDEGLPAAEYRVSWDGKDDAGRDSASGVYFLKLENGGLSSKRKITLLK